MLSLLRRHAASTMIKIILGLIVIVFVFWGFEGFNNQRSGRVAQINGEVITVDEYRQAYNNLVEQYRKTLGGDNFNDQTLKMLQLDKKALDYLIDQRTHSHGSSPKLNFTVTDEELTKAIKDMTVFHNGSGFDSRRYHDLLQRARLSPEEFESQQRHAMTIQKLRSFITRNIQVSDAEARQFFRFRQQLGEDRFCRVHSGNLHGHSGPRMMN